MQSQEGSHLTDEVTQAGEGELSSPNRDTQTENEISLEDAADLGIAARDAVYMKAITEKRDQKALSLLFNIYADKLKGWLMARGAGNGTAEDIVQDVMMTCWTRAHLYDPEKASFATWVYRLTRNRFIDYKRKYGRMETRDPELMKTITDDQVDSAEDEFMMQESIEILEEKLVHLSDVQAQALRMAFMEFKTHQQISEEIDVPLGTIKTRIRSAIAALRHQMDKDERIE